MRLAAGFARGAATAIGVVALFVAVTAPVLAASPTPAAGGDPRSSGQGPGLVGEPGVAVLAVVAIGLGSLLVTLVYVRLTGGSRR